MATLLAICRGSGLARCPVRGTRETRLTPWHAPPDDPTRWIKDLATPLLDAARERQDAFSAQIEATPRLRWWQFGYWRFCGGFAGDRVCCETVPTGVRSRLIAADIPLQMALGFSCLSRLPAYLNPRRSAISINFHLRCCHSHYRLIPILAGVLPIATHQFYEPGVNTGMSSTNAYT